MIGTLWAGLKEDVRGLILKIGLTRGQWIVVTWMAFVVGFASAQGIKILSERTAQAQGELVLRLERLEAGQDNLKASIDSIRSQAGVASQLGAVQSQLNALGRRLDLQERLAKSIEEKAKQEPVAEPPQESK